MIKNGADVTASSSGVWGIYGKGDITIANSRVVEAFLPAAIIMQV